MKSILTKSIYAGLGLLGSGKESVEQLGRKLAKKANLSEKEGEKIARKISTQSDRALGTIQKALDSEVKKVVKAFHDATRTAKRKTKPKSKKATRSPARRAKAH